MRCPTNKNFRRFRLQVIQVMVIFSTLNSFCRPAVVSYTSVKTPLQNTILSAQNAIEIKRKVGGNHFYTSTHVMQTKPMVGRKAKYASKTANQGCLITIYMENPSGLKLC